MLAGIPNSLGRVSFKDKVDSRSCWQAFELDSPYKFAVRLWESLPLTYGVWCAFEYMRQFVVLQECQQVSLLLFGRLQWCTKAVHPVRGLGP